MVVQQFIGLLMVGVGALFAYRALKTYRIAERKHTFESVSATVVDSQLEEGRTGTGQTEAGSNTETTYRPHITWEYTVEGETYVDNKRYGGSSTKADEREIVDNYPEGETVEVQYDPADPATSFLEDVPGKGGAAINGAIGGILVLFGLVLLLLTPL